MTSFQKRSPPRLQSQSNSKQALALHYSTMIPLSVEVFEQENECLLVFLVTHATVILLHSRNRKTHLSMFDRLWQTRQYKKICMKEMSQGCNLVIFYDPLYNISHYWMYYYNIKNTIVKYNLMFDFYNLNYKNGKVCFNYNGLKLFLQYSSYIAVLFIFIICINLLNVCNLLIQLNILNNNNNYYYH